MGKKSNLGSSQRDEDNLLSYELEAASDDDFSLVDFINYAGYLEKSGPLYKHAYGYEALPYSCVQSLKMRRAISRLNDEQYCSLLHYYQTYFNPAGESSSIFGKDDSLFGQHSNPTVIMDERIAKFTSITILGQRYSSNEASSARGSFICAYYRDSDIDDLNLHVIRPCQIQFFFRHTIDIMDRNDVLTPTTFTFAYVKWYKFLPPSSLVTTYDSINSYCVSNTFMDASLMDILPVHCIYAPVGIYPNIITNCNIVITLPRRVVE
jgi:hypothetical protein